MGFNNNLFRQILAHLAKNTRELDGKYFRNRQELYQILSEVCYVQPETVRSWTRIGKSPNPTSLDRLEQVLNVEPGFFAVSEDTTLSTMDEYRGTKEKIKMVSDFTKNKIFEVHECIIAYFEDINESDERLDKLWWAIERFRIALPNDVYDAVKTFLQEDLADFVNEREPGNNEAAFLKRLKKHIELFERWKDIATQSLMPYMI